MPRWSFVLNLLLRHHRILLLRMHTLLSKFNRELTIILGRDCPYRAICWWSEGLFDQ